MNSTVVWHANGRADKNENCVQVRSIGMNLSRVEELYLLVGALSASSAIHLDLFFRRVNISSYSYGYLSMCVCSRRKFDVNEFHFVWSMRSEWNHRSTYLFSLFRSPLTNSERIQIFSKTFSQMMNGFVFSPLFRLFLLRLRLSNCDLSEKTPTNERRWIKFIRFHNVIHMCCVQTVGGTLNETKRKKYFPCFAWPLQQHNNLIRSTVSVHACLFSLHFLFGQERPKRRSMQSRMNWLIGIQSSRADFAT